MSTALIVITGASSGIGLACARAFVGQGHGALLLSRHVEPLPEFAGKPVTYAQADVADFDSLRTAVQESEAKFGPVDCLINNAGIADGRPFDQVQPADYEREIRTNLLGVLNGIKVV